MKAATEGGLFTGACGLVIVSVVFYSNDNILALLNGVSPTGMPISPLIVLIFGTLLITYGILSVVGVLPKKYEWS